MRKSTSPLFRPLVIFILTAMMATSTGVAQTPDSTHRVVLDQVVVSPGKTEEHKSQTPFTVEHISSQQVELLAPQTSADLLINSGALFVQKSQAGGGSPNLRGFEASRVLLVVDGVRMNNAIYRAGHVQDVVTIDPAMLDHTEVIFGPSSLIYGSDALGGVMHFFTKRPQFGADKALVKVHAAAGYVTGNSAYNGHVDVNVGGKKFASLTSVSYNSFGDVRSGGMLDPYDSVFLRTFYVERIHDADSMVANPDPTVQVGSGYSQYDVLQKFAIRQNDRVKHTLNLQMSNSSDVPRYDRLTEVSGGLPRFAEWNYGPQKRMLGSVMSEINSNSKLFSRATVVLSAQSIGQARISRKFGNVNRSAQTEGVGVYAFNADLVKLIGSRHELRYGADAQHNMVRSTAVTTDITTGVESPAVTRYPDGGSRMTTFGVYLGHRFRQSEKLILSEGIRFSMSSLKATFVDTTFFAFPFADIAQSHSAVTGNIGLVLHPVRSWKFSLVGSSGFRSPNVDDLTKIFESSSAEQKLIIPNPDIQPELAYNGEVGIEKTWMGSVRLSVTGWATSLRNAMVVQNATLNGQDSVMYQGVLSQVQTVQNADNGLITGVTGSFAADFSEHFSMMSTATVTRGTYHNVTGDTMVPLDHIPPAFGKTALIYSGGKLQAEVYALYNGWKRIEDFSPSGEDNAQYATVHGMPSWLTLNVKAAFDVTRQLRVQAGVENIFDLHYRYFASGISASGRSVNVMLRARV